jgi:antitoxin component of RelBE/YafQ-DinJ toxin-antitoxin module
MYTLTLKIDESDSKAREFLLYIEDFARKNDFVDVSHTPNKETLKSLENAQKGKVFRAKDSDDLFRQLEA